MHVNMHKVESLKKTKKGFYKTSVVNCVDQKFLYTYIYKSKQGKYYNESTRNRHCKVHTMYTKSTKIGKQNIGKTKNNLPMLTSSSASLKVYHWSNMIIYIQSNPIHDMHKGRFNHLFRLLYAFKTPSYSFLS